MMTLVYLLAAAAFLAVLAGLAILARNDYRERQERRARIRSRWVKPRKKPELAEA